MEKLEIKIMVETAGWTFGAPMCEAKRAIEGFASELDLNNTYVSIIDFADTSKIACEFTKDKEKIQQGIDRLGNLNTGFSLCACPFYSHGRYCKDNNAKKVIIILTGGSCPNWKKESKVAEELKREGYIIYAVGFGPSNALFLNEIASENCVRMAELTELRKTFKEIGSSLV